MNQQPTPRCSAMIASYYPVGMRQCARTASQEVAGLFPACTQHARAVAPDFGGEVDELADMVLDMKTQAREAASVIERLQGEASEWRRIARVKHGSLADGAFMPVGPRPSVVYYIQSGRYVKIGKAINPEARLRQLRLGGVLAPRDVRFHEARILATEPGGLEEEYARHAQFSSTRVEGEWFAWSSELRAHVDSLINVPIGNNYRAIEGHRGHSHSGSERVA